MDQASLTEVKKAISALVPMDPNQTEFESLKAAVLAELSKRTDLTAFVRADTIDFLIDAAVSGAVYAHYGVDVAWGEAQLPIARLDESIRSVVRTLGVRLKRKTPSSCSVLLTRGDAPYTGAFIIPSYSIFTCNQNQFFNRNPIQFQDGEAQVTVELYEGQVKTKVFTGVDKDYARVAIQEENFGISDNDVVVTVNSTNLDVTQRPIWHWRNIFDSETGSQTHRYDVVEDYTLAKGYLELRFGSELFAYKLRGNDRIIVTYAVTKGKAGRVLETYNQEFILTTASTVVIKGVGQSVLSGGDDELSADTYRTLGPFAFSSSNRAIDSTGYRVTPREYPGVLDVKAASQAEYAPEDIRYNTIIKLSVLNEQSIMSDTYWKGFLAFMKENGLKHAKYLRDDPRQLVYNIEADVYIRGTADSSQVEAAINKQLAALFAPRFGIIGLEIAVSDISEVITNSHPGINYIDLISPTANIVPYAVAPTSRQLTIMENAGSLPTGDYQYYVTVVTTAGETLPTLISNTSGAAARINQGAGKFILEWEKARFGIGYRVYRRQQANNQTLIHRLTTLNYEGLETTTLTDDGVQWEAGKILMPIPTVDTSGVFYPKLGTVTVNIRSSDRIILASRREAI